jgi:cytochrome oxidase assembly protein ShyY1
MLYHSCGWYFLLLRIVLTYNIYDFHKRKRKEKLREMEIRKERIFQEPQSLNLQPNTQVPWVNLPLKEFNEQWAYKPFYLYGYFNHNEETLVERIKEGKLII